MIVLAILIGLSLLIVSPLFEALVMGALLAYITHPLYRYLRSKIKNKFWSAFIVCLLAIVLIIVPGFFLIKALVHESYALFTLAKQKLARGFFENCTNSFCQAIEGFSNDPAIHFRIQEVVKGATNWVINRGSDVLLSVPQMVLNLFVIFFTMFYFLKDGKRVVIRLNEFLSFHETKYKFIVKRFKEITKGIIFGYVVVAAIQGVLAALGFYLFGVNSPLFWGVVVAFAALLPFLGTALVWVPIVLIMLLDGIFQNSNDIIIKAVGLGIYCMLLVSSVDNLLRPKLVSEKAKVHPAVVLLGILGGTLTFGAIGVILGPLILSLTQVFVDTFLIKRI